MKFPSPDDFSFGYSLAFRVWNLLSSCYAEHLARFLLKGHSQQGLHRKNISFERAVKVPPRPSKRPPEGIKRERKAVSPSNFCVNISKIDDTPE